MDADTFLAWELDQQDDHELVAGQIISTPRGRTQANTSIVSNILVALTPEVRLRGWSIHSRRLAMRTGADGVIYPSLSISTDKADPTSSEMAPPAIVVEVLEPEQRLDGISERVSAIRQVAAVHTILLVSSTSATVAVHRRNPDDGWTRESLSGMDSDVALPALGMNLTFATIYDGLDLDYVSRLENLWDTPTP